jgi:hypothetical protein
MLASRLRQRVFERGGSGSQIAYGASCGTIDVNVNVRQRCTVAIVCSRKFPAQSGTAMLRHHGSHLHHQ